MSGLMNGGVVLQAITVRVECDAKIPGTEVLAYPGLWAEVRQNLTNGERRDFRQAADALDARAEQLNTQNRDRQEQYVAALKAAEEDKDHVAALIDARSEEISVYAQQLEQIGADRFALVAPHVHAWNLYAYDDAGEPQPVPAPRDGGTAVLDVIEDLIVLWLVRTTMTAYRMGFPVGSRIFGAPPEPTPEPSDEKPKDSGSSSRPSRKKSSSPSPSKFEA